LVGQVHGSPIGHGLDYPKSTARADFTAVLHRPLRFKSSLRQVASDIKQDAEYRIKNHQRSFGAGLATLPKPPTKVSIHQGETHCRTGRARRS
jgi:hypothetical protein